jgi:hypothetical protein
MYPILDPDAAAQFINTNLNNNEVFKLEDTSHKTPE